MKSMLGLGLSIITFQALSHGYISQPESRSYLCKTGDNTGCGAVQWEPQSVEGSDGFPQAGVADGELAAGGISHFSELNQSGTTRWHKTPLNTGWNTFSWHFTANHVTQDWRYFITKPGWNPEQALTRDAFELAPFCAHSGNLQRPAVDTSHQCYIPDDRQGYHVILGVWDVGDTANSFYQVIDVELGAGLPNWSQVGTLHGQGALPPGSQVSTRVFINGAEVPEYGTTLSIDTHDENWSKHLAEKINAEQTQIRAGYPNAAGEFAPQPGLNPVYALNSTNIERIEISISQEVQSNITISEVASEYVIRDGHADIVISAASHPELVAELAIIDAQGNRVLTQAVSLTAQQRQITVPLSQAVAGHYQLELSAMQDNKLVSALAPITLVDVSDTPDADFEFPSNIRQYKEGTRVKHATGVYQCKPFPYSGYCSQWSKHATQFEPGTGSHWQLAWTKLN